jgi:ADP-heptose:LPS heptosyltransferase
MMAGGSNGQLQQDRGNPRLKFLDRYAGIPVIQALGLRRRVAGRRAVPDDWRTIGLIKTVGIGDIVLLSAVIHDLRAARPDARIVLFVSANNLGFARLLDEVDAVVPVPVRNVAEAVRTVRAEHCDVVVDFGAWPRFESLLTVLSGARATVGMRTPGQHRDAAYDVVVEHGTGHEIENYRRLIGAVGVTSESDPSFPAGDAPRPLAAPYVVLHLWPGGANFAERSWANDRWRDLARAINDRGYDVVLTGGGGDVEPTAALVASWQADDIRAHSAAGGTPQDTITWLRHAVGLVSVNTGVMHLGAALGVPVVVLNGPTSGRRWGPRGAPSRAVASPMVPEGYLNLGWERDDRYRDCMAAITVDAVVSAWDDLMTEVADTPPRFGVV